MSVKRDEATGERSVTMEVEVPGTPEQVWRAMATGPGTSAWFVPTEIEERVGGELVFDMGPEMGTSKGTVTAWEPPHRFAYEERDWMPGAPPVATEIRVDSQAGGTCLVRMVHSLFADSDDWDDQLESFEKGWPGFFRILRLYLAHFEGRRCSRGQAMTRVAGAEPEAWRALTEDLGLAGASVGDTVSTSGDGAPPLSGTIEHQGQAEDHHDMLLRSEEPAPGFASLGTFAWGGTTYAAVSLYRYGEPGGPAPEGVGEEERAWRDWLAERAPADGADG
jgi:uncharacterized protein YndB with AHSA1/START domain